MTAPKQKQTQDPPHPPVMPAEKDKAPDPVMQIEDEEDEDDEDDADGIGARPKGRGENS